MIELVPRPVRVDIRLPEQVKECLLTTRVSQIKKSKTQLLVESLAVAQATPVLVVGMLDEKELAGGSSPTSCSSLVVGLNLTAKMQKPCGVNDLE